MSEVLENLQSTPHLWVMVIVAIVGLGEGIVGVGFFFPGPVAMLGAAATISSPSEFVLIWLAATTGAVVGNTIGFEIGRRVGPALRERKMIDKHAGRRWDQAATMVRKHGRWAVFVGRLLGPLQCFVPPVAGAAGMSYRGFLPPLLLGAACSQALPLLVGLGAFASLDAGGAVVVAAIVLTMLVVAVVARRRRRIGLTGAQD
ncbi:DedA family protein [Micromonospora chalcea]|uniref:DedA family protein n=1 Tax=Micromonospora chalcea TaxID=1874 RepID=UPI0016575639|nr:DedA family protein [Micromonospora chalcea]MBC8989434.1 DedA family protein [Micromonospora chalcea]